MKRTRRPYKRTDIKKQDILLEIIEDEKNDTLAVNVKIYNLSKYNFPSSAQIFLEAYNRLDIDHIPLGAVGSFSEERVEKPLPSFKPHQRVKINFRLKIVDMKTWHLLGLAERLKEIKYANSLLAVHTDKNINTVYTVKWDEVKWDETPLILSVNKDFEKLKDIKPIIAESVFKEILVGLLFFNFYDDADELENHKWIQFAQKFKPQPDLTELDNQEKREWINSVIDEFSKKEKIVKKLLNLLEQEL